jgi:ParB family chromosome partitioning protein
VRWDEAQEKFVLICGERRWRAAGLAGLASMSCVVSEGPIDSGELLAMQLVENCLREDLKPIEQAKAFKAIMERNGWSGNQAAKELGIAQPTVVRALALLELPPLVQEQVEQGALAPATAYEIGKARDPEIQQELAARVVNEGLSRSEAIEAVTAARQAPVKQGKGRGVGRSKKLPTSRTLKAAGCKITVEHRKGVDDDLLATALREALEQCEANRQQAA